MPLTLISNVTNCCFFCNCDPGVAGSGLQTAVLPEPVVTSVSESVTSALIPVSATCHSSGLDSNEHYISVRNMFFVSVGSALSSPSRQKSARQGQGSLTCL